MQEEPLSIQLPTATTKTAIPQIANETWAKFRLVSMKQFSVKLKQETYGTETGRLHKWEFDLVDPVKASDGSVIEPGKLGAKQFVNVQLYAKPDAKDPEWFVKKTCRILDALLGTDDPDNKKNKPPRPELTAELVPQLIGKVLLGKMKESTNEGVTRTDINEFAFPADMEAKGA